MFIAVDVETIPSQAPDARELAAAKVKPPANYKKADTIAAWETNEKPALVEAAYRDGSLKGETAHLACISFAIDDEPVVNVPCIVAGDDGKIDVGLEKDAIAYFFMWCEKTVASQAIEDRQVLREMFADAPPPTPGQGIIQMIPAAADYRYVDAIHVGRPIIVAHHAPFDIRMIWQRATVLGVPVPAWWPIDVRPWDRSRIVDTMTMWCGEQRDSRISLDRLCKALGIPGKGPLSGAFVYDAILAGKLDNVVAYCGDDVRRLRSCHRRLTGLAPLEADIARLTTTPTMENAA